MKGDSATPAPLPPEEWNFSGVPDSQAEDVRFWEYARESAAIRSAVSIVAELYEKARSWPAVWEVIRQHTQAPAGPDAPAFYRTLQATDGRWRGLAFVAAMDRVHGGSQAHPWLAPWQAVTGRIVGDVLRVPAVVPQPLQETVWEEARERQIVDREQIRADWQPPVFDEETCRHDGANAFFEPPELPVGSDPDFRALMRPGVGVKVLRVNWQDSTNKEIVAAFKEWMKGKRPEAYPEPARGDGRPRAPARIALKWLAYARALRHTTPAAPEYPQPLRVGAADR